MHNPTPFLYRHHPHHFIVLFFALFLSSAPIEAAVHVPAPVRPKPFTASRISLDRCAGAVASRLSNAWLPGENVTIVLQQELNTSFFFVEDAPERGIDPMRSFLQRAESNVRELYHHLLYKPNCENRDGDGRWGTACAKDGIVVDVGANRGYYTLLAASYGHDVLAFEPQPHCNALLSAAVLLSGLACHVDVRGTFASDTKGADMNVLRRTGCTGTFPNDDHDGWASGFRKPLRELEGADDTVRVLGERVDEAITAPEVTVRLMKIDAEGHEASALQSARSLLRQGRVYNLLIEFNVPMLKRQAEGWEVMKQRTIQSISWLMKDLGYKAKGSHKGHWTKQEPMNIEEWIALFDDPSFTTIDAWFYK